MVPDPEFAAAAAKTGKMGDEGAPPPLPGKKSIDLIKKDNIKKGKLTDEEVENRNGEKMKFILEGDTGKFGNYKIQDILCFSFVTYINHEENETCAIVTGGADGMCMFLELVFWLLVSSNIYIVNLTYIQLLLLHVFSFFFFFPKQVQYYFGIK